GRPAASVLRIQSLVVAMSFISTASAFALLSIRRYRPLMIASLSALVVNVVLALALVPALGARGASLADVLTETAVAVGLTATLARAMPRRRIDLSFLPATALACGLSLSVWLAPIDEFLRVALATAVYFGILLPMGTIPN